MSAKVVICLLAAACLRPVDAFESGSKYLELSNVEDTIDEYGLAVFSGEVHNTHTIKSLIAVNIHLVLKKNGRVIGTEKFYIDPLKSLEVESFRHETLYTSEDYDEFYMLADGIVSSVNIDLVVGEVYFVEESFNVVDGVIYGEVHNATNAVISGVELRFTFFDARGDRLFVVTTRNLPSSEYEFDFVHIGAGGRAGFAIVLDDDLPWQKIESRKVEIGWKIYDMVDIAAIATGVESASWGDIKAMGR